MTKNTNVDNHTTLNFPLCILFQGILHVVIKKMKYDESYNFEHEVFAIKLVSDSSLLLVCSSELALAAF